jgi:hypothetical protein
LCGKITLFLWVLKTLLRLASTQVPNQLQLKASWRPNIGGPAHILPVKQIIDLGIQFPLLTYQPGGP